MKVTTLISLIRRLGREGNLPSFEEGWLHHGVRNRMYSVRNSSSLFQNISDKCTRWRITFLTLLGSLDFLILRVRHSSAVWAQDDRASQFPNPIQPNPCLRPHVPPSTVTLPRDEGKRRRAFRKRDRITVALSSPFVFAFAAALSLFVLRGAFLPAVAHVPRLRNGEAERLKRNLRPAAEFCTGIFAELYPFLKSTLLLTKFDQSTKRPDVF